MKVSYSFARPYQKQKTRPQASLSVSKSEFAISTAEFEMKEKPHRNAVYNSSF